MPDDSAALSVVTTMLAGRRGADDWQRQRVEQTVKVEDVQKGLEAFLKQLRQITVNAAQMGRTLPEGTAASAADQKEEFLLEEMTFNAEVSPEGEFKLLGSGIDMAEGGVKFVWRRKHVFGTANLTKTLLSSVVAGDQQNNELRAALVGPKFDTSDPLQLQAEITNIVRTVILDVVQVLLVGA